MVQGCEDDEIKISVALCTFNGATYLPEQINSILSQTVLPDEVVICDDASSDDTLAIVAESTLGRHTDFRVYKNPSRLGFIKNFERCIQLCKGKIIFLCDQDDIWMPEKIEKLTAVLDRNPKVMGVTHEGRLVNSEGQWYGTYKNSQIISGYGKTHLAITGALSCLRASSLDLVLPIPPKFGGHDVWITYINKYLPGHWMFIDDVLADIRRHDRNTSQWVANGFHKITRLDVIYANLNTKPAITYRDRYSANIALTRRLRMRLQCSDGSTELAEHRALEALGRERLAILRRSKLVKMKRLVGRWHLALAMLLRNEYRYFNGIYSLMRDLFRRV